MDWEKKKEEEGLEKGEGILVNLEKKRTFFITFGYHIKFFNSTVTSCRVKNTNFSPCRISKNIIGSCKISLIFNSRCRAAHKSICFAFYHDQQPIYTYPVSLGICVITRLPQF